MEQLKYDDPIFAYWEISIVKFPVKGRIKQFYNRKKTFLIACFTGISRHGLKKDQYSLHQNSRKHGQRDTKNAWFRKYMKV